jgi:hypothetical protein
VVIQADPVSRLAQGSQVSLACWLGDPLDVPRAQQLSGVVRERTRHGRNSGAELFNLRLAELICRFWTGGDIEAAYETLSALPGDDRQLARLELCYGQLFMARRQQPAWQHLDRGFQLAANLLEAEDYFRVLGRHELLRQIPLQSEAGAAAPLDALLREARVIARLRGSVAKHEPVAGEHRDTLG